MGQRGQGAAGPARRGPGGPRLTAEGYAAYLLDLHRRNPAWQAEHREWVRRFGVAGRVLDLGCGLGHLAAAAEEAGATAVGLDRDPAILAAGRREVGPFRAVCGDALSLPFRSGSYDWALSNQVIEHVETPAAFLLEARRVLRPGGRLLLTTPNRRAHLVTRRPKSLVAALLGRAKSDPTHVREFTPREISALVRETGFVLEHREAVGRNAKAPFLRPFAGGVLLVARSA